MCHVTVVDVRQRTEGRNGFVVSIAVRIGTISDYSSFPLTVFPLVTAPDPHGAGVARVRRAVSPVGRRRAGLRHFHDGSVGLQILPRSLSVSILISPNSG
jgi:hypothetical protein